MSDSLQPGRIIGAAQARDVVQHLVGGALPAQLQQRPLQPGQVALAPGSGRNADAALVEVDQPAFALGRARRLRVEEDVVCIEIGVVQAGAMETREQLAGGFPWRAGRIVRGQRGQRSHAGQAFEQDRGAIAGAAAPVAGGDRPRHGQAERVQGAGQAELAEAAGAVGAVPGEHVAADPCGQATAQILAQHCLAERRVHEPCAAAPAGGHRRGTFSPPRRVEPAGLRLLHATRVEQNRPIAGGPSVAPMLEWRQAFVCVEGDHPASLTRA
jgi:hypothetical protein